MSSPVLERVQNEVKSNNVVIYMKGTPAQPMCGFSSRACEALRASGATDIFGVNALEVDGIREALKEFSDWPTLPQVYIGGEFVGGCDIIVEMEASGDLAKMIGDLNKAG